MKEQKDFEYIGLSLTKKQLELLAPFRKRIVSRPGSYFLNATPYVATNPGGQKIGSLRVYIIPPEPGEIIRKAIFKARKKL